MNTESGIFTHGYATYENTAYTEKKSDILYFLSCFYDLKNKSTNEFSSCENRC